MADAPLQFPVIGGDPNSPPPSSKIGVPSYDFLRGLGASTLQGMTGLIGVDVPGAAEFSQDHPFLGFTSQLASAAIPYTGWFKAAKAIKSFDSAINSIGVLEKSPFLIGAAREAARFAPFELGRLAVSQAVGTHSFSDMAGDVALSLGVDAGLGGLVHGLASAGTRNARVVIPGVDISAPAPLQLRQMKSLVAEGSLTPEATAAANARIKDFDVLSRRETPERGKYVFSVNNSEGLTRNLNSMFNVSGKATTVVDRKPFISRSDPKVPGFSNENEWKATAATSGLPEDFSSLGQYFRYISFRPTGRTDAVAGKAVDLFNDLQAGKISPEDYQDTVSKLASKDYASNRAKAIDRQLTSGMESLGDNWLIGKEDGGLYVMARKTAGTPGTGSPLDQWVIFKTDSPGAFVPSAEKWKNVVLEKNSWHKGADVVADGGRVYNGTKGWQKNFPLQNVEVLSKPGRLQKLIPQRLKGTSNELAYRLADGAREYLAPAAHQLRKSRLGNYILQSARVAYETADTLAHETVYGRQAGSNKNLFLQALRPGQLEPGEDSFKSILDPVKEGSKDLEDLQKLWRDQVDPATYDSLVSSGDLTPLAAQTAQKLNQLEGFSWGEYSKLAEALGETPKKPLKGHLGISRYWEGDTRIALRDQNSGELKAMAAGPNRKAAQSNAKKMLALWPDLKRAEEFDISQISRQPRDVQLTAGTPGFMNERTGIRGYKWDLEPWTKEELLKGYQRSQSARMRYMADKTVEDLLTRQRKQLMATDPVSSRIVESRIQDLQGKQSDFAAWQNKVSDQLLAPLIGTNSATKLVGITNTAMHTWSFGMGNIAFPLVNALTFVQTVLPEASMIMSAGEHDLSFYTHFAAGGTKGPVGSIGVLSPMKLMAKSMREMGKPRPELLKAFQRAASEGVVAPRLVEDYVGETGTKVSELKRAFSSGKGFVDWTLALSNWLPANSEKLARTHAFTVGYMIAKDILKIPTEDAIYRLARQFTEKTMFMYSASDRPRIFTTPIGSALGLFKTWMMNYMAAMLEYSGQAVKGNFAPLAWQTAGTAAVGGLAATPLYWIADGFSKAFTNDTLLQNTYNNLGESEGDALMFGLPAALTGISLYSQVSSPLANPARDASMLWSAAVLNRLTATSKAAGLAFDHWQATGENPGRSPGVRDALVKALAPVSISRVVQAFSNPETIMNLGTGSPILPNVSLADKIAYALKFNPVEIDKAQQVSNELYAKQDLKRARIIELGTAFAEAQGQRDSTQMNLILRQATLWGLDVSSVLQSSARRLSLAQEPTLDTKFRAQDISGYRTVLGR